MVGVKYYKIISHTADIGIKVSGKDKKELFANAGRAFFDILTGLDNVSGEVSHTFKVKAKNQEDLLFNFLDELLYRFSVNKSVFRDFKVSIKDGKELSATATGETFKENKHKIRREIKAVTYHNFKMYKFKNKWYAKIIFDI